MLMDIIPEPHDPSEASRMELEAIDYKFKHCSFMKILITGATGFVGRTLIPYLFSHSLTDICLLVRDRQKAESMFPGLCLEIIATTEGGWCKQVIGYSPDVVIHMATFFTARRDDMFIEN